MNLQPLGRGGLRVSRLALGTMTFGEQNTQAEAHAQLDLAFERGINLIDTAEMYPVPSREETQGRTETIVGNWLIRQPRDRVILATKVTGPARGMRWIRGGPRLNAEQMRQALEDSLRRLRTDYIDLYQIHWPDRYVPMFGASAFDAKMIRETTPILEQLEVLDEFVRSGKVRHIGLSNETPWGVCQFAQLAERHGLPRVASIQNAYHLLNRTFETGLAEACYYLDIPLLAYSPLAFGLLTGKYLDTDSPAGRLTRFPHFARRYAKPAVAEAVRDYVQLARDAGLSPTQMAIAFVLNRPFIGSVILGATDCRQLEEDLGAQDVRLSPDLLKAIEQIHLRSPNPAP